MEVSCTEFAIQKFDHDSKMEEPDKYMYVRKEMLIQTAWVGGFSHGRNIPHRSMGGL